MFRSRLRWYEQCALCDVSEPEAENGKFFKSKTRAEVAFLEFYEKKNHIVCACQNLNACVYTSDGYNLMNVLNCND